MAAVSKVYNGATWVTFLMKSKSAGSFFNRPHFHDGTDWVALYPTDFLLTLNPLVSDNADPSYSAIRVNRDGTVEEYISGAFVAQNVGVEWISDGTATIGDAYEVRITGTGDTPTGLALNTWYTINTSRVWQLEADEANLLEFSGTITIREIANTANNADSSVDIVSEDFG